MTTILVLNGSPSAPSLTGALATAVGERLANAGALVTLPPGPLADLPPIGAAPTSDVLSLRAAVDAADAIVVATPVHNSSYSALIKNTLDHIPAGSLAGKPAAVVANGGSRTSGFVACEHLRSVLRSLGATLISAQVATSGADFTETAEGSRALSGELAQLQVNELAEELMTITVALTRQTELTAA